MKETILIIEDDAAIREGIGLLLSAQEFEVVQARNGFEELERLSHDTDLVILDIMMPGISGIKTCEKIREISNVPILFLTAKDQDSDKMIGFAAGGDDYLIKPFSYAELTARVKALLRRYRTYGEKPERSQAEDEWICVGKIRINFYKGSSICPQGCDKIIESFALAQAGHGYVLSIVGYHCLSFACGSGR